uniref:B30.2/SPRY domain-containing protein n=1 Tax=Neogobius melanostomus TaxID=47308 RepID=A0A8C6UAJ9_9GOBI
PTHSPTCESRLDHPLHTELQPLLKHRAEAESVQQLYKNLLQHSEKQASVCEAHIKAEFRRFRRFLQEEEELRLRAVMKEQSRQARTVSTKLGRIRDTLASVERSIQELQTQLQRTQEDFIFSYKPAQTHSPQLPPQPGPGLLLNQAELLGNLAFRVWRKMGKIVQSSPVILDPNTAHPDLRLSEDLTRLGRVDSPLDLPDNPERFSKHVRVLGSEGFSSGTHVWDVEVGDHPHWRIGVMKESFDRKGEPDPIPENGIWFLLLHDNKYVTANGTLNIRKRVQKVSVQLNYDKGTVSFYDPSGMYPIHTYKDSFTEKLFPFFYVARSNSDLPF